MVGCVLGDTAGGEVGVGGTATVAVGVGGIAADGAVGVGMGAQAATKTTATMNTMVRFIAPLRLLHVQFPVAQPFHHVRVTMVKKTTGFCV